MEKLNSIDVNDATVTRGADGAEQMHAVGVYHNKCFDKDGNLKWEDTAPNIITNQGKNYILDQTLGLSPALASNWWMSLITSGTAISSSTYASPTITEITSSIVATRPTVSWSASSGGSKSATTTAFSIIGSATITGNILVTATANASTVGNTAGTGGILFSSSAFTGGSKSVTSGDTLQVSYSVSV